MCDATDLAVILFPMYLWGFSPRIHPSDIPVRLIRRLLDDCPNIAVIKADAADFVKFGVKLSAETHLSAQVRWVDLTMNGQLIRSE